MRKIAVLLVTILLFPVIILAQQEIIPGGIIYSDKGIAFYQEISSGKKTSLGITGVTGPIVVSQDSTMLAWESKGKIFVSHIPSGPPIFIYTALTPKDRGKVENISFSPNNDFLAIEIDTETSHTVKVISTWRDKEKPVPESPLLQSDFVENTYRDFYFPVWATEKVTTTNTEGFLAKLKQHFDEKEDLIEALKKEGPVVSKQLNHGWRIIQNKKKNLDPIWVSRGCGNLSALIGAKSQNENDLRIVSLYRNPASKKWGPIGYQYRQINIDSIKGGWFEILWSLPLSKDFSSKECRGLAVKPDRTVTYITDNAVLSEDNKVIAKDIEGTNLAWISNEMLLFKNSKNQVVSCRLTTDQPETKKLLDSAPEKFSYCPISPLSLIGKRNVTGEMTIYGRNSTGLTVNIGPFELFCKETGNNFLSQKLLDDPKGSILTESEAKDYLEKFYYKFARTETGRARVLNIRIIAHYERCLTDKQSLADIADPSTYVYAKESSFDYSMVDRKVVLFKNGKKYLAIRIVSAGNELTPIGKYYNPKGFFEGKDGKFTILYVPSFSGQTVLYEWKYWPNPPSATTQPKTP